MEKRIVLSVNDNPIYLFTLPLVVWSWLRINWTPVIMFHNKESKLLELVHWTIGEFGNQVIGVHLENIEGYRSDTIAQVSRLYAAAAFRNQEAYFMTGDSDMMALSDYWKFDEKKITVWGHDLTGYQQMPICYIGMTVNRWVEVMGLSNNNIAALMKRDLDEMPDARENGNHINRWCADQRLITQRINEVQFEKDFIHRGVLSNGYPIGRIDRSAWATYHPMHIDCHLPHDIHSSEESFLKVIRMLHSVFPNEDFKWFVDYTQEFKAILNG